MRVSGLGTTPLAWFGFRFAFVDTANWGAFATDLRYRLSVPGGQMAAALAQAGLNLFIAACLGASIGLERQWRQHLAGLRTNTLVALGAAIFITYARAAGDNEGATRIAAQVVSGIGFLGAGVIFKEGLNVRGLNTAATLWCSAAVGLLAARGWRSTASLEPPSSSEPTRC
jgi:hypothetical protein